MIWEGLKAEREEGNRMRWLDGITNAMDINLGKLREMVKDREALACYNPWGHEKLDMTWPLNNNNVVLTFFCSKPFSASPFSLITQLVKNLPAVQETPVDS